MRGAGLQRRIGCMPGACWSRRWSRPPARWRPPSGLEGRRLNLVPTAKAPLACFLQRGGSSSWQWNLSLTMTIILNNLRWRRACRRSSTPACKQGPRAPVNAVEGGFEVRRTGRLERHHAVHGCLPPGLREGSRAVLSRHVKAGGKIIYACWHDAGERFCSVNLWWSRAPSPSWADACACPRSDGGFSLESFVMKGSSANYLAFRSNQCSANVHARLTCS